MRMALPSFIPPHMNQRPNGFILTLLHRMCQRGTSQCSWTDARITRAIQAQIPHGTRQRQDEHH